MYFGWIGECPPLGGENVMRGKRKTFVGKISQEFRSQKRRRRRPTSTLPKVREEPGIRGHLPVSR